MSRSRISIISVHYLDFDWTGLLMRRLREHTDLSGIELLLVDNDRTPTSRQRLSDLAPGATVAQFPVDDEEVALRHHDHGSVLDRAIVASGGEIIVVFDSDAHPVSGAWLPRVLDLLETNALVGAADNYYPDVCHPCFIAFRRSITRFAPMRKFGHDVGRMLSVRLREAGQPIHRLAYTSIWPNQGFL